MPNFYLNFDVNGATQTITATNKRPLRAGSKNYWYATFNFLDDNFDGLEYLSASFSTKPYSPTRTQAILVPIVDNKAQIPWEMMTRKRKFYIGVFAGDMLVTNEEVLEVTESAPTGGIYSDPTSSWYNTFIDKLEEKQDSLIAGEHIHIDSNNEISADLGEAVLYSSQELTLEEAKQARENIGAGTEDIFIIYTSNRGALINIITPCEDFINALNRNKTINASINYNSLNYILHNFKIDGDDYYLWEVIPATEKEKCIGHLIQLRFSVNDREQQFIGVQLEDHTLGEDVRAVVYDRIQNLAEEEMAMARKNIGAGTEEVYTVDFNITGDPVGVLYPIKITNYDEYEEASRRGLPMRARVLSGSTVMGCLNQYYDFGGAKGFYDIMPLMTVINNSSATMASIDINGLNNSSWTGVLVLSGISDSTLSATSVKISKRPNTTELEPFRTYWFKNLDALSVTLRGNYNESSLDQEEDPIYHFFVVVGQNPIQISLPSNIGYAPGAIDALVRTNTVIEVSISKIPSLTINGITYNYLAYANYMEFNPWD